MMIAAVSVVVAVVSMLALIWTLQRRLIHFPTADVPTTDAIGRADIEPVSFETVDGLRLNGWFFAVEGPSPRMTVVVFNGNAGIERIAFPGRSAASARAACCCRLPRLRRQSRDSIAGGLAADSRAARAFLVERPDVDSSRLVYFGESLERQWLSTLPSNIRRRRWCWRSPFTSMSDVGQHHYPFLPVRFLPGPVCVNRSDSAKSSAHASSSQVGATESCHESSRLCMRRRPVPRRSS